jgi:hypothetical protein
MPAEDSEPQQKIQWKHSGMNKKSAFSPFGFLKGGAEKVILAE